MKKEEFQSDDEKNEPDHENFKIIAYGMKMDVRLLHDRY
jgi:hypothetical protein